MDPPSPSKLAMSPGMPIFQVSPERVQGTKPRYSGPPAPQSPSLPELRTSPIRKHRRGDSSVSSLASMFENLGVKDPKDVHAGYLQAIEKQKARHANEIQDMQRKYEEKIARVEIRNDELKQQIKEIRNNGEETVAKDVWDAQRKEHREAIAKWEESMRWSEGRRKEFERKAYEFQQKIKDLKGENAQLKKEGKRLHTEALRRSDMIPTLQTKIDSLQRNARILESDLKFKGDEAEKYKNMVYGLQVDLESVSERLGDEVKTLKDKLRLVEGERDALKTSLREEEVLRIAAEGRIPLPAATVEEHDDFALPVRSPRKQRTPDRDDDKENVAPRKAAIELKFVQQDLAAERRLRERAQDQVEFMKMECQFRCCSCRIADMKGARYVHDGGYTAEMERIKASLPELTPPSSNHENEAHDIEMTDLDVSTSTQSAVVIKQEPKDENDRPITPPLDAIPAELPSGLANMAALQPVEQMVEVAAGLTEAQEAALAFSPTTGTFRAVPSPAKEPAAAHIATPARPALMEAAEITELSIGSSPWNPDANSTVIPRDRTSFAPEQAPKLQSAFERKVKPQAIAIHEDAVDDSDEEDRELKTPLYDPPGPATPAHYFTRTVTTTTTIPLHFSPMTPAAAKGVNHPMTPSTIAHAPTNAQTHALGEVSLNTLPIDREAALEMIRQRRGRARSMAMGQSTPGKQMMIKERRDISAPVYRLKSE